MQKAKHARAKASPSPKTNKNQKKKKPTPKKVKEEAGKKNGPKGQVKQEDKKSPDKKEKRKYGVSAYGAAKTLFELRLHNHAYNSCASMKTGTHIICTSYIMIHDVLRSAGGSGMEKERRGRPLLRHGPAVPSAGRLWRACP